MVDKIVGIYNGMELWTTAIVHEIEHGVFRNPEWVACANYGDPLVCCIFQLIPPFSILLGALDLTLPAHLVITRTAHSNGPRSPTSWCAVTSSDSIPATISARITSTKLHPLSKSKSRKPVLDWLLYWSGSSGRVMPENFRLLQRGLPCNAGICRSGFQQNW